MNMEALFLKIVNMSFTASYVIAVILLIRLLLKRAPRKYAYALWAIVLFRLVCPVAIPTDISLFNVPPFDMGVAQQSGEASLRYVPSDIGYMEKPSVTVGLPAVNALISDKLPQAELEASMNPMQAWILTASVAWCAGAAILLGYGTVSYWRLKRRLTTAVRLEGRIYESDAIRSPFIFGFFKPRIYIPFGLGAQERAYVLRHEACHLGRRDHLIKPLAYVVLVLHWFNPLVWLAYALMAKDMEISCDERVLSENGSGIAKDYCATLLAFASNRRFPSAGPLAFGETSARERIKHILRYQAPSKRTVVLSVSACLLAAIVCATNPTVGGAWEEPVAQREEAASGSAQAAGLEDVFGEYEFHKQIYMNPLSSFMAFDGFKAFYLFTDHRLVITDGEGNETATPVTYKRITDAAQGFASSFRFTIGDVPDLSQYAEVGGYELVQSGGQSSYRLYLLDDEIWLATMREEHSGEHRGDYVWSIYQISRLNGKPHSLSSVTGSRDDTADFLTLNASYRTEYEDDESFDLTPSELKEHTDYRVYKYKKSAAAFLMYEQEIYALGESLGGNGVTSMAAADMDGDGRSELYFTYSFGSGLHRSHIAYFDPADKQIKALPYVHMNGDLAVTPNEAGDLSLYSASLFNVSDFAHFELKRIDRLGTVVFEKGQIALSM